MANYAPLCKSEYEGKEKCPWCFVDVLAKQDPTGTITKANEAFLATLSEKAAPFQHTGMSRIQEEAFVTNITFLFVDKFQPLLRSHFSDRNGDIYDPTMKILYDFFFRSNSFGEVPAQRLRKPIFDHVQQHPHVFVEAHETSRMLDNLPPIPNTETCNMSCIIL